MYSALLGEARFYRLLQQMDEDLADTVRAGGCPEPECGGVLHSARFRRKPRGMPAGLVCQECWRLSFCCATEGCRHRTTPPSLRFLGRKVYLAAVVTIITAMRCGITPERIQRLNEWVGVSRQTVLRWQAWWQHVLPETACWRAACGAFSLPVASGELPLSALERFTGKAEDRLLGLLRLLAPLTGGHRSTKSM
jgi:hypothetical protein